MSETIPRRSRSDKLFLAATLLGSFIYLAITIGLAVWAFYLQSDSRSNQAMLSAWSATAFGFLFLLGLPGVYWAMRGHDRALDPAKRPKRVWAIALIFIPVGICLGSAPMFQIPIPSLLGSLGYPLAIAAVVLAIVLIVRWLGPPLSARRAWGHFLIGLWGMPIVALILEGLLFIPSLLLLVLGLMLSPDGQALLEMATTYISTDPQILYESILSLTMKPWVIGLTFFNFAFLVPLLEEMIKAMATVPLIRRKITPAQGFLGGALAGAGFALFEALFVTEPGQAWLPILIGRTGTTLMHIFTAALTNWALVRSVRDRKWGTFALAFAGAVGLHGIWNASSVGIGLAALIIETEQVGASAGFATLVAGAGLLVLIALSGLSLVALPWISRRLGQTESAAS
jgi:hypothetical protein